MTLFKNKYRVESTRLPGWDYASPGYYFVTICTQGKQKWFGKIVDDQMILNDIGKIVQEEWLKTAEIRKYVQLDAFIIMPDHIHGIIILGSGKNWVENRDGGTPVETMRRVVSVNNPTTIDDIDNRKKTQITIVESKSETMQTIVSKGETMRRVVSTGKTIQANSLGAIVGQFKSQCTKRIHVKGYPNFSWQSRYHDSIIRNERSLVRIRKYIHNNPLRSSLGKKSFA